MYNNLYSYKQQYLSTLFNTYSDEQMYATYCQDSEYINGNTIFVKEASECSLASLLEYLVAIPTIRKVEFNHTVDFADELETQYLLKSKYTAKIEESNITIEPVVQSNYDNFLELANVLQIQEYDQQYMSSLLNKYLSQNDYKWMLIREKGIPVGIYMYFPVLNCVESVIIEKSYWRKGIGSTAMHLHYTRYGSNFYLSCAESEYTFYEKNNFSIIDCTVTSAIYGSSNHLLTFFALF